MLSVCTENCRILHKLGHIKQQNCRILLIYLDRLGHDIRLYNKIVKYYKIFGHAIRLYSKIVEYYIYLEFNYLSISRIAWIYL